MSSSPTNRPAVLGPFQVAEDFDLEAAREMVGARVLCGMTFVDFRNVIEERFQFFGTIMRARSDGIAVKCEGVIWHGEEVVLPPDLSSFSLAKTGEYSLASTGEVVIDPDFTTSWTMKTPPKA